MTTATISNPVSHNSAYLLRKLPASVRQRYNKVVAARRLSEQARQVNYQHTQSLVAEKVEIGLNLDHARRTLFMKNFEGSQDEWEAHVKNLESDLADKQREIAAAQEEMRAIPSPYPVSLLDTFLGSHSAGLADGTMQIRSVTTPVKLAKGEDAKDALAKVRERHRATLEAIGEVLDTARLPQKVALENAFADIDRRARKGKVYFARTRFAKADNDTLRSFTTGKVQWPMDHTGQPNAKIDIESLFFALHADRLKAEAADEIERVYKDEEGDFEILGIEERRARVAELRAQALALEYEERALLDMIGNDALARSAMSPEAFLGVEVVPAPPKKAEPPEAEPVLTPEEEERLKRRERLRSRG